jgi:hypothetical protein
MAELTREGEDRTKRFLLAQESVRRAKDALNSAECELSNSEADLAKWLMPSDMKPGEKVAVWMSDSLFQVELVPRESYGAEDGSVRIDHVPKVTIRTRGKHHHQLS